MQIRFMGGARIAAIAALAVITGAGVAGCSTTPRTVSYQRDVAPLLADNCAACHGPGAPGLEASGFGVESYQAVTTGGRSGPVIKPGDPGASRLVTLIEGRDPTLRMPHVSGMKLTASQIATIRRWIEQGARND
jgi:mono/diheme cytochrome c family protein